VIGFRLVFGGRVADHAAVPPEQGSVAGSPATGLDDVTVHVDAWTVSTVSAIVPPALGSDAGEDDSDVMEGRGRGAAPDVWATPVEQKTVPTRSVDAARRRVVPRRSPVCAIRSTRHLDRACT
jgi:hypothetical protein